MVLSVAFVSVCFYRRRRRLQWRICNVRNAGPVHPPLVKLKML